MIGLGVALLQTLCCLGLGAGVLRALRIDSGLGAGEHWAVSFAVGLGVLGWLVFPVGILGLLSPGPLAALLVAGALPAVFLRRSFSFSSLDRTGVLLLALVGVVMVFDIAEGIAPPADADTLYYHFNLPKLFLAAGRIKFILEPLHGTGPFLVQMTYVPALALGGELGVTLWVMISGWAAAAFLFVLCRPHLDRNWSLAVTLVYLTTPAVIYGGGTGQVEPRIVLFVLLGAWAANKAVTTGQLRYAALAGFGAGLFAAAKYTGLLFAAATGVVILVQRRWIAAGSVFAVALLAAGFQWYAWNWVHTGDPTFPALFQWLGRDDLTAWSKAHDLYFKEFLFRVENPLPQTLTWLLLFPFKATLNFAGLQDAGRVGFGPYGLLVLPFALIGLWQFRHRARQSPLIVYGGITALFYLLWFFLGGSQRIRHLLPVLPLLLICLTVAAGRLSAERRFRIPLLAAIGTTLILQMGVQGIFALNHIRFLANGADRETFLLRNVNAYAAATWINKNLPDAGRLFFQQRQLRYYLNAPALFGTFMQGEVEMRPEKTDARKLHRQLREAGVTHLLLIRGQNEKAGYSPPLDTLDRAGCLLVIKTFRLRRLKSRTLPGLNSAPVILDLLKLQGDNCLP